jgi:hypothetical protein
VVGGSRLKGRAWQKGIESQHHTSEPERGSRGEHAFCVLLNTAKGNYRQVKTAPSKLKVSVDIQTPRSSTARTVVSPITTAFLQPTLSGKLPDALYRFDAMNENPK